MDGYMNFGGYPGEDMDDGEMMASCDDCKINPATVRLTHVERNEAQTFHLCEECARARGVPLPDGEALIKGLEAIVGSAMAGALAETHVKVTVKPPKETRGEAEEVDVACPGCRMKLSEFRGRGRLGCARCYESFEEQIGKILFQVHGADGHTGKRYGKAAARVGRGGKKSMERLRRELDEAISGERFEQAAVIRDAIHSLKQVVK